MSLSKARLALKAKSDKARAKIYSRFFKTGPGEYGEGDKFIGVKVPDQRLISKEFRSLDFESLESLINSRIHEERALALFILIIQFKSGTDKDKKKIFQFYIRNRRGINNWDLVDLSAPHIPGPYLVDRDRSILYKFARSNDLWERRIGILSTFAFIRQDDFRDTLRISEILLADEEDLIHKAVGWLLREIGKRDIKTLESFLKRNHSKMPRTALRYSIERFPEAKRLRYLRGDI